MIYNKLSYSLVLILCVSFLVSCSSSQRFSSAGRACPSSGFGEVITPTNRTESVEISRIPKEKLNSVQERIVEYATTWIGVPYLWGGNTRKGVDCSGFVKNVYDEVGVSLPRTAQTQYNYSNKIQDSERRTGDLVFFSKGTKISHVGIYVGKDEIIHSASGRGVVRQSLTDSYLQKIYVGAGRVLDK